MLVTLSIIAVLLAILIPSLGTARASSRSLQCGSNQRQLIVAWEAGMIEERGVIPLTTHTTGGKYWVDVIRDQLPELPLLVSTRSKASSPAVCSTTESAYPAVIYFNGYVGYAINTRWTEGLPSGSNEFKKWEAVPKPASYPWFADPYVSQSASPVGFSNMGVQSSDGVSWNIGFEHTDDVANSVFADGHVEQVRRGDLMDVDAVGTPLWFLADH